MEYQVFSTRHLEATTGMFTFLPRDAMHKPGYCQHAVSVCLSVRLSVCHVRELRQKNKDIFEIFSLSGSQAILIFLCQTGWR